MENGCNKRRLLQLKIVRVVELNKESGILMYSNVYLSVRCKRFKQDLHRTKHSPTNNLVQRTKKENLKTKI